MDSSTNVQFLDENANFPPEVIQKIYKELDRTQWNKRVPNWYYMGLDGILVNLILGQQIADTIMSFSNYQDNDISEEISLLHGSTIINENFEKIVIYEIKQRTFQTAKIIQQEANNILYPLVKPHQNDTPIKKHGDYYITSVIQNLTKDDLILVATNDSNAERSNLINAGSVVFETFSYTEQYQLSMGAVYKIIQKENPAFSLNLIIKGGKNIQVVTSSKIIMHDRLDSYGYVDATIVKLSPIEQTLESTYEDLKKVKSQKNSSSTYEVGFPNKITYKYTATSEITKIEKLGNEIKIVLTFEKLSI